MNVALMGNKETQINFVIANGIILLGVKQSLVKSTKNYFP